MVFYLYFVFTGICAVYFIATGVELLDPQDGELQEIGTKTVMLASYQIFNAIVSSLRCIFGTLALIKRFERRTFERFCYMVFTFNIYDII